MIQIDRVDFIPKLPYTKFAQAQLVPSSFAQLSKSQEIYVVSAEAPLFCIGFYKASLIARRYAWLLACEELSPKYLKILRKLFTERMPKDVWLLARPEIDDLKFLKFFGFKPVEYLDNYLVMEL